MKTSIFTLFICLALLGCKSDHNKKAETDNTTVNQQQDPSEQEDVEIHPISHATAVIKWGESHIYIDPTGGRKAFDAYESPDLVLITDIHADHLDPETLGSIELQNSAVIVPEAVREKLSDSLQNQVTVLRNNQTIQAAGFTIEAIPMYNLREEAKAFHPKGRGNGYIIEKNGRRVYIAGDTEDIPEMRSLEQIDIALIPMNLPYTMTVEKAADAVLDFAPRKVYPYHFRGKDGKSDVEKFRKLVQEGNPEIQVEIAEWYPAGEAGE